MIINRIKQNESTLCNYSESKEEIIEGHILCCGDNYPCVVMYDKFDGRFCLIEFGYKKDDGYIYRYHDLVYQTSPMKIVGHIDNPKDYKKYLKGVPKRFDLTKDLFKWYKKVYEYEPN